MRANRLVSPMFPFSESQARLFWLRARCALEASGTAREASWRSGATWTMGSAADSFSISSQSARGAINGLPTVSPVSLSRSAGTELTIQARDETVGTLLHHRDRETERGHSRHPPLSDTPLRTMYSLLLTYSPLPMQY